MVNKKVFVLFLTNKLSISVFSPVNGEPSLKGNLNCLILSEENTDPGNIFKYSV